MSYASHLHILKCPVTGEDLRVAGEDELQRLNGTAESVYSFTHGLVNSSGSIFYPVLEEILMLLPQYALRLTGTHEKEQISFDRQRIFNYFKEIGYYEFEGNQIYG
jgi:uncharacterized protein YbaR (Trm112 family)